MNAAIIKTFAWKQVLSERMDLSVTGEKDK